MLSIIQAAAKLSTVALALLAALDAAPVSAASSVFIATNGVDGGPCSFTQPCQTLGAQAFLDPDGQLTCLPGSAFGSFFAGFQSVTIDCPGVFLPNRTAWVDQVDGTVITFRNLTFNGGFAGAGAGGISLTAGKGTGGMAILENCVFENFSGTAIQIATDHPYTLILRNTRFSNNGSGIVLKPASGGSVNATLDHVTISLNTGGGIKVDTTNGPVTLDITDSIVSNNGGNGINAVGGAGGQNMVSIKNGVIAKNAVAGVQANGANAGVMIATTLLDQNTSGALSVVNGGHIATYGNNQVVGAQGSNFTGTAPLK
jgi:hypothetical protein